MITNWLPRCGNCGAILTDCSCPCCGKARREDLIRPCIPLWDMPDRCERDNDQKREPDQGSDVIVIEM